MEISEIIRPGMAKEEVFLVEEEHSAAHVGSGSLRVLATPWMILYMERVARKFLGELLPEGYTSVGTRVDVQHLAPAAVGSLVRARVEVTSVDGSRVVFTVEAWDKEEKIGAGQHQRAIVDEERFLRRVAAKIGQAQPSEQAPTQKSS